MEKRIEKSKFFEKGDFEDLLLLSLIWFFVTTIILGVLAPEKNDTIIEVLTPDFLQKDSCK